MSLTKKVYLTISGYDIKLSDNLMFYQNDQLKLIFYINEYGIDYENNATTRTLMPVNPLNAILFIENPEGVDSVSSAKIEDNAVTFYLDSTHTQYVGISRMQLRLFDQDGCAITLPHFTFEIRENIYGRGDVRFQNVVMVDQTGTVILTEDNDLLDVGDILTMGTEVAYPQVAKTIKELPIKHDLDGTEKLIVEDDEATKQAPLGTIVDEIKQNSQEKIREIESELAQTNAQLSDVINLTNQFYKASVGVNIWYRSGSSDNYRDEVLDDMINLGIKQLIIPCHNEIAGDDTNGFTYIKDLTQEKIGLLINKARAKGIEDIIIKLHRTGLNATSSVKWLEMWEELVHEYTAICVKNNIKSLVIVNEQRNATNGNKEIWKRIIDHVKSNGLTAICSLADFTEIDSCVILDLVDVIGVNHYPAVVRVGESVTQSELNRRIFQFSLPKFRKLKLKYPNKPIWITEIGCTRNVDSLSSPASWEFDTTTQSMIPQSQFVESVFSIFACFEEGLIDSVNWWSSDTKDKINTFTFFGNELAEKNFKKYMRGE